MHRPSASLLSLALLAACSSSSKNGSAPPPSDASAGTQSLWVALATIPCPTDAGAPSDGGTCSNVADTHFYDHPWPSDLRRAADGTIDFTGFYNPRQVPLIDQYVGTTAGLLQGFSPASTMYVRFTGDIDPTTLPADPPHSILATSSVQIVNVGPASPEHGKRRLLETFWQQADGVYWFKDTLAVRPALGYPLLPATKYALVVTKAVKAADGSVITPSSDLAEVLGLASLEPSVKAAHDLYAPAVADLGSDGIAASDIAHLAVFTTNDPTAQLFSIFDDVHASLPAP